MSAHPESFQKFILCLSKPFAFRWRQCSLELYVFHLSKFLLVYTMILKTLSHQRNHRLLV